MWKSIDPWTGECWSVVPLDDAVRVNERVETLCSIQYSWRRRAISEREACLVRLAKLCEAGIEDAARIMVREMGKPIVQARAEIRKCAWLCRYMAEHGGRFLQAEPMELDGNRRAWIRYEPLGLILGIMPWNFPFWQVFRFAVPALLAGNAVLIKHAPNVGRCSGMLVRWFHEAGIEAYDQVVIDIAAVEKLVADTRVAAVSLTGSRRAGRAVAALAGRYLKKSVLELGGSDPYLVLADADVELAARQCVAGRMLNSGQTCIAAKRWIVVDDVYDDFRECVLGQMRALRCGNPMEESTEVGPLAREDLRQTLHDQVQRTLQAGARCVIGGQIPSGPGYLYPPTLLEGVRPDMPAFEEEVFGPVAVLVGARDEQEALRLANASRYGLGAGIFSRDEQRALKLAASLEAGNIAINGFVVSDPRLPFGGVKESGYGRELGVPGLREFVNIKSVVCEA